MIRRSTGKLFAEYKSITGAFRIRVSLLTWVTAGGSRARSALRQGSVWMRPFSMRIMRRQFGQEHIADSGSDAFMITARRCPV